MSKVHHLFSNTPEVIAYDALVGLQDNDADSHRKWLIYGAALNDMKAKYSGDNNAFGEALKAAGLDVWPSKGGSAKLAEPIKSHVRLAAMWAASLKPEELEAYEAQYINTEVTVRSGFRGLHSAVMNANKPKNEKTAKFKLRVVDDKSGESASDDIEVDSSEFDKALAAVLDALKSGVSINDLTRTYLAKTYGLKHTNADYALHYQRGYLAGIDSAKAAGFIDPSSFPKSTQKKLEIFKRQMLKQMDALIAETTEHLKCEATAERDRFIEEIAIPEYVEKIVRAEQIERSHRGVMTKAEYNKILFCLHPDRFESLDREAMGAAFAIFNASKIALTPGNGYSEDPPLNTEFVKRNNERRRQELRERVLAQRAAWAAMMRGA